MEIIIGEKACAQNLLPCLREIVSVQKYANLYDELFTFLQRCHQNL